MSPTAATPPAAATIPTYSAGAPGATAGIAIDPNPPAAVQLLQWQDVPTTTLAPFAPSASLSLPMAQYAVRCTMAWGLANGLAGSIPTWETGPGTWGVIGIMNNAALSRVSIPIAQMESFSTSDTAMWAQAVMRWATAQGYQMAIPTFESDGTNVTALAFGSGYTGIVFYDAPNAELYQSLTQAHLLCDLQDPAVWANSAMRVAMAKGFAAGWPTWEYTTSRGIMGMSEYDLGSLPDANGANVQRVLSVLSKSINAVQIATVEALAEFAGIYEIFNEAPVSDPGLRILTDCLFGAVQIALNAIPVVGGAINALVCTAVTVAQDAANKASGGGATTLETYQLMLAAASNATVNYIADIHDQLVNAASSGNNQTLQAVWEETYQNPLSNQSMQLGLLAVSPNDVAYGEAYWLELEEALTAQFNQSLEIAITNQLYKVQRRTYKNAPSEKQWFWGTFSEVTAPGGKIPQYITSSDDEYSTWFTDFAQEPGHARGPYVTATEIWLQSNAQTLFPEYAPQGFCKALFSSDGFGDTTGYSGVFSKYTVYNNWLMTINDLGDDGAVVQQWSYGTNGNIVTATIDAYGDNDQQAAAGWTDAYGNLNLNSSNPIVSNANKAYGFAQGVIVNFLAPLG